jgi:sterol desaturase/sphingolipid hydroxylase (fatty acid hydroxylase superfamily)
VLPRRVAGFLAPLLVTPDFHRLHYSRTRGQADVNCRQLFSCRDQLFASQQHGEIETIEFGVADCLDAAGTAAPSGPADSVSLGLA